MVSTIVFLIQNDWFDLNKLSQNRIVKAYIRNKRLYVPLTESPTAYLQDFQDLVFETHD